MIQLKYRIFKHDKIQRAKKWQIKIKKEFEK